MYEQAAQLREIGASLVVAPNGARLLRQLGVLGAFEEQAVRLDVGWEFRRWQDGTVLSAEDLALKCQRLYGEHTYTAHRGDLLGVIRSAVPAEAIRLGRRVTEVRLAGERPVLRFSDGEPWRLTCSLARTAFTRWSARPLPSPFRRRTRACARSAGWSRPGRLRRSPCGRRRRHSGSARHLVHTTARPGTAQGGVAGRSPCLGTPPPAHVPVLRARRGAGDRGCRRPGPLPRRRSYDPESIAVS